MRDVRLETSQIRGDGLEQLDEIIGRHLTEDEFHDELAGRFRVWKVEMAVVQFHEDEAGVKGSPLVALHEAAVLADGFDEADAEHDNIFDRLVDVKVPRPRCGALKQGGAGEGMAFARLRHHEPLDVLDVGGGQPERLSCPTSRQDIR